MSRDQAARIWTEIGVRASGDPVTVAHVCAAMVAGIGADGVGVTVMASPTVRETIHATDRVAGELEEGAAATPETPQRPPSRYQ